MSEKVELIVILSFSPGLSIFSPLADCGLWGRWKLIKMIKSNPDIDISVLVLTESYVIPVIFVLIIIILLIMLAVIVRCSNISERQLYYSFQSGLSGATCCIPPPPPPPPDLPTRNWSTSGGCPSEQTAPSVSGQQGRSPASLRPWQRCEPGQGGQGDQQSEDERKKEEEGEERSGEEYGLEY